MAKSEMKKQIIELLNGRELKELPRVEYMELFNLLQDAIFKYCSMPTVGDIADFVEGIDNITINNIIDFLDNEDKLRALANKTSPVYTDEESDKFIEKVISSNITDISKAGYFYKKLISSCDDIKVVKDDCGSEGKPFEVSELNEQMYLYRIKFAYINELEDYCKMTYSEFEKWVKDTGITELHVRTPMSCNLSSERHLCAKCAGVIKKNDTEYFTPKDFGLFSTLCVTEHSTQSSLDSMNKGKSENINLMLDQKTPKKLMTWEEANLFAEEIIEEIGMIGVQARYYEVALMSRFYEKNGKFVASSLQYSFQNQNDPLGIFAYSQSYQNFLKLISAGAFEASSTKSQIAFDIYMKRINY